MARLEVNIVAHYVLCNVKGCKNPADYRLVIGTSHALDMLLCEPCVDHMCDQISYLKSLRGIGENRDGNDSINGNDRTNNHVTGNHIKA